MLPADAIGPERIAGVDLGGVELVCLSYLGPAAVAHARQACRRLRRRAPPGAQILVGLWGGQLDKAKDGDLAGSMGADLIAATFAQAVERIERRLATAPRDVPAAPTAAPAATLPAAPANGA